MMKITMARFTVAIFMLWSMFGIDAERQHEPQFHNMTHLEKRSPVMSEKLQAEQCEEADYRTVRLFHFVYEYECFPPGWKNFLNEQSVKDQIEFISDTLFEFVKKVENDIEPPMLNVFKAFTVPCKEVKVVILGQDPISEKDQATGLAFSLNPGVDPRTVPSVLNMLVELKLEGIDVGFSNGVLTSWRDQGVLLLNAALTVTQGRGQAGSHQELWKKFTKLLIEYISENCPRSAWILLGEKAKWFKQFIKKTHVHFIKTGGHPSRTGAANFFGHNYFRCANLFLEDIERGRINWQIPPHKNAINSSMNQARCRQ